MRRTIHPDDLFCDQCIRFSKGKTHKEKRSAAVRLIKKHGVEMRDLLQSELHTNDEGCTY